MSGEWRAYRPAIWLTMIGVAVIIAVSPHYLGAFFLGGAIGAAIRIRGRRARGGRGPGGGGRGPGGCGPGGRGVR